MELTICTELLWEEIRSVGGDLCVLSGAFFLSFFLLGIGMWGSGDCV
jgi:hypothetical protein